MLLRHLFLRDCDLSLTPGGEAHGVCDGWNRNLTFQFEVINEAGDRSMYSVVLIVWCGAAG